MSNKDRKISGIERVLNYTPTGKPVVSAYLMVDRTRTTKKNYQTKLNSMIAKSREILEADDDFDKNHKKEIFEILEKIKSFVNDKFSTGSAKTLVVFSSGDGLWEEFRVPIIMKSRIIIDPKPYTQNLRNLINNSKKYGVLLVNREKAQIYSVYLGEVNEYLAAFISDVPSKVNFRSEAVLREKKLLGRLEEKLHHFFKLINDKTLELFKEKKFDYLILSGKKEIIPGFLNYMHSYLQQVYIGGIDAEPDSKITVISKKAKEIIDKFELSTKNDVINKLIDEYNPNRMGVLGIDAVIRSLLIDQIKILIYEKQFTHSGYVCDICGYLTLEEKKKCPYCEGELVFYNDIVDEIVENALDQGCEIIDIDSNERLNKAGSIGAVLRYKM
jgi:peptide subunit release factor 1 (eRF1)